MSEPSPAALSGAEGRASRARAAAGPAGMATAAKTFYYRRATADASGVAGDPPWTSASTESPYDEAWSDDTASGPEEAPHEYTARAGRSRRRRLAAATTPYVSTVLSSGLFLVSDILALVCAAVLGGWITGVLDPLWNRGVMYPFFTAYLTTFVLIYALTGLYSDVTQNGPAALRRVTLATLAATLSVGAATYAAPEWYGTTHKFFVAAAVWLLFAVPLGRAAVRAGFCRRSWWGRKVVVIGSQPEDIACIVDLLLGHPALGFKPQAVLSTRRAPGSEGGGAGLPQLRGPHDALRYVADNGIDSALVTLSRNNEERDLALLRRYEQHFKHWTIVPVFTHNYSLWVQPRNLNGILGLDVSNQMLRPHNRILKRGLDLLLTTVGGLCILPVCLLIALAIKLDSKGPALYSQTRVGKDGKPFRAWKFRSMIANAEAVLDDHLAAHPEQAAEWAATQKLKADPRITRVGRFLRRTSLDELPQLINVLRGDMSLVGPRPCMPSQVRYYGRVWELYKRARPGITGQWQVSGRNNTSYAERIALDAHYIRNWSPWLDLYILARTVAVVVGRDGAY